ncbi:hypothetical protein EVAR_52050_1 [Eumeta japonica]|uniref:Uncharacterized protein n=1 Tax=Eumeta variegata TaxID=151549 RepID=A0A4C1Z8L3_EUMVA|nr:hypothetical protein EVAR_52050_1 [Eumeta japonica]
MKSRPGTGVRIESGTVIKIEDDTDVTVKISTEIGTDNTAVIEIPNRIKIGTDAKEIHLRISGLDVLPGMSGSNINLV